MHAICVYCGSPCCTCFDTDEEYEQERKRLMSKQKELIPADAQPKLRERGPFDGDFEKGHVPSDEPPGFEEREYRDWKAAGGVAVVSTPAKKKRGLDEELQTMARIDRLLCDLEPAQVARVLAWLNGKHARPEERVQP